MHYICSRYQSAKYMNLRYIRRIIYGLVSFLIIVGAGLFLFRNVLLRSVAADKIASLSSRYNMHIAYSNLSMPSIGNIRLDGLTVVPHHKDTLLTLKRLEVSLDLLPLLGGNISVGNVDVDGMRLTFIKQDVRSNYDFLFRKAADTDEAKPQISQPKQEQSLDYAARVKKSLALLFRLLPEDAHLQNLTVIGQRDTLQTRFFLPDMVISDNSFDAVIHVSEGDLSNDWSVSGKIDCGEKQLDVRMASAHDSNSVHPSSLQRVCRIRYRMFQSESEARTRWSADIDWRCYGERREGIPYGIVARYHRP